MREAAAEGEMKLNVKTLKGTSFEIEASPEESVRFPFPYPLQSDRFRAIHGRSARFSGDTVRFHGGAARELRASLVWPRGPLI